jgi:hypothetical protein
MYIMTDAKDDGLIEKEEDENILIDEADVKLVKKKNEKPKSEKQIEAHAKAGERMKKIHEMKRVEKERIQKEQEAKIIADLKEKWTKEYHADKKLEEPKGKVLLSKSLVKKATEVNRPRKVKVVAPAKSVRTTKKQIQANSDDETEEDDSDDDHVPQTDCESTDTRTIKKKLAKVKQIEQVVGKQAVNPYLSLLEKYYK